jgi:hypothetical protein
MAWHTPAVAVLGGAFGAALAFWPVLILAVAIVGLVALLAIRAPEYAFILSIVLFASEGWLKAMLGYESVPISVSADALGAALLDLCLIVSVLGLIRRDARARVTRVYLGLPRSVQLGFGLLALWVVLSAVQVLAVGSVSQGVEGFRLVQGYVVLGIVGALVLERLPPTTLVPVLLGGLLLVSGYAALRIATGPGEIERAYNISRAGIETFGGVVRAAGSFSAAVGLASYLVPAAAFAFAVALAMPRYRLLATIVFGLAITGIIRSYVRTGVVALEIGVLAGGALVVAQSQVSNIRRLVLVATVALTMVTGGIATAVASRASSDLEERAEAYVNPIGDESVRLRFETWKDTLSEVSHHPLGTGIGSVGRASSADQSESASTSGSSGTVITDNSYLKILREQGWLVGPIFIAGIALLIGSLGLASLRRSGTSRPLAVAALAGAVSFLALGMAGEYVEQPGKTLAWLLLGLAALEISGVRSTEQSSPGTLRAWLSGWLGAIPVATLATWGALTCVLVAVPVGLTLARESRFVAAIEMTPRSASTSPTELAATVNRLLADFSASFETLVDAEVFVDPARLGDRVSAVPTPNGVRAEVWGTTPTEADRLAAAVARTVSRAEKPGIALTPAPGTERLADRVADALPGRFPARPDPLWAGLAGLAVGLVSFIAIVLVRDRSPPAAAIRVS